MLQSLMDTAQKEEKINFSGFETKFAAISAPLLEET